MRVEISNWKEVKNHFGITLAKIVSINLRTEFQKAKDKSHLEPHYDDDGYALFELHTIQDDAYYYQFNGTAK